MKPHEETWEVFGPEMNVVRCVTPLGLVANICGGGLGEFHDRERARLAAQAPAMARLLVLTMDDICDEESEHWQAIRRVLRDAGVIP